MDIKITRVMIMLHLSRKFDGKCGSTWQQAHIPNY